MFNSLYKKLYILDNLGLMCSKRAKDTWEDSYPTINKVDKLKPIACCYYDGNIFLDLKNFDKSNKELSNCANW